MKTANILDRRKESHSLISARTSNHTCCLKLIARILIFALASSSASFYFTCRSCSTLQCLDNIPGALSISATCVSNKWDNTVLIKDAVCNVRLPLRRLSLRLNLSTAQELELSERKSRQRHSLRGSPSASPVCHHWLRKTSNSFVAD